MLIEKKKSKKNKAKYRIIKIHYLSPLRNYNDYGRHERLANSTINQKIKPEIYL